MPERDVGRVAPIYRWQADEDDPWMNNKIILTHAAFKGPSIPSPPDILTVGAQQGSIFMTLFQFIVFRTKMKSVVFFRSQTVSTFCMTGAMIVGALGLIHTGPPVKNYDRAFRCPLPRTRS
jgi:hypothetical protein